MPSLQLALALDQPQPQRPREHQERLPQANSPNSQFSCPAVFDSCMFVCMRRIDPSRAILVYWANLTFHEAAVLADDTTKHLAPPVTKALADFTTIFQLDLDSRREVLKTQAKSGMVDVNLDERIRKLHSATLFLVDQVRKRPEFTSLFSETIDKVVRFALKRQVEVAEKLVDTLGLKLYSDEFRNAHLGPLQALIGGARTVLGEVRNAEIARTEARLDIRAWKDDVNAILLANYGELTTLGAKAGRSRDWADAFFMSNKRLDNDDEIEEQPPENAPTP